MRPYVEIRACRVFCGGGWGGGRPIGYLTFLYATKLHFRHPSISFLWEVLDLVGLCWHWEVPNSMHALWRSGGVGCRVCGVGCYVCGVGCCVCVSVAVFAASVVVFAASVVVFAAKVVKAKVSRLRTPELRRVMGGLVVLLGSSCEHCCRILLQ